jgi:hypothetical protein
MPFDEKKWRIPPRFLKSHEAMSKYAHKVLAPKLTQKQRELLFQYFTEIFTDGFESGDFSAWTGSWSSNGTAEVNGDNPHHGLYNAEFATVGAGTNYFVYYKTFTEQSEAFARCYLKLDSLPSSGKKLLNLVEFRHGTTHKIRAGIHNDAGTMKWLLTYEENGAWGTEQAYTATINAGQYYCVEIKFVASSTVGEARLYIDDNEIITATGINTGTDGAERVVCGIVAVDGDTSRTLFIDCVVVADTYIGSETTEQTYTKTWTTDALFKKLGIAKTLSVDIAFQKQNIPKTFGLDSTFQKSFTIQQQIDLLFKKLDILETFGIDADFLKNDIIKSFTLDARFGALMTHTISKQIDVLLKKLDATKTFGLDIYFGSVEAETYAKSFGLSVIFAYKVRLPELWLDENGKIVLNISKPYTWVGS